MRRPRIPEPQPVLVFSGISEPQWQFLRLRPYDGSDAQAAKVLGISARVVEGWKKRSQLFRAVYSMAVHQPRLFAAGELLWYQAAPAARAKRTRASEQSGLEPTGVLYRRAQVDLVFARELRQRELALTAQQPTAPPVDLRVPEEHGRPDVPPCEMGPGERRLAETLGVDHCVVLGWWNGRPTVGKESRLERAVDVVSQFRPETRMPAWYPDGVLITSAGTIVVADGTFSRGQRCPLKARGRCPLVDRRGVNFGSCPHWDLGLETWLDLARPTENTPRPICHRDFGISRLLAYVAAATRRGHGDGQGWYAAFPVVRVRNDAERAYWTPRVQRWNNLILDPWHRIHLVDLEVIIDALADFRVRQTTDHGPVQSRGEPTPNRDIGS